MKILPLLPALLLLAGCASGPFKSVHKAPPATATFSGDTSEPTSDFMGSEIHCRLQSVDGVAVEDTTELAAGSHTVIAVLSSQGTEYVAVIQLRIPTARKYRISARRRDEAITVTLLDAKDQLVATSTATISEQMKFNVFVHQG